MLRKRISGRQKQDEIYPVTVTGANTFTLDGHEYTARPNAGRLFADEAGRAFAAFAALGRRQPTIIAATTTQGTQHNSPFGIRLLAQWLQSRATPGLSRAASSAVPAPSATPTSEWVSASGSYAAVPLGLVVLSDGTIVTAQTIDDSGWELQLHVGGTTYTLAIATPGYQIGLTDIWSNATATLAIVAERVAQQIFRKRASLLEALTLTGLDLANTYWDSLNLSAGGQFSHGAYLRSYAAITSQTGGPAYGTAISAALGGNTVSTNVEVQGWTVDVSGTTIAETWGLDPASLLSIARPLLFGCLTAMPAHTTSWRLWVSGRQRLDAEGSAADQNLCHGAINITGLSVPRNNYAPSWSRALEAKILSVSQAGEENWAHTISATPTTPVIDAGLLGNLTDWLESMVSALDGSGTGGAQNYYSWAGRYDDGDLSSKAPLVTWLSGPTDANFGYPTQYGGSEFQTPQHQVFGRTGLILLPQSTPNNRAPVDVDGTLHNLEVFTEWGLEETARLDSGEESVSRNDTTGQLVVDADGNTYAAYLKPIGLLAGGSVIYDYGELGTHSLQSFGYSRNMPPSAWTSSVYTDIDGGTYRLDHVVGHSPDFHHVFERRLRKISLSGALIVDKDLTQLVSGAVWAKETTTMGGFGATVACTATGSIAMGDNIWKICPVGRVVFLLADFHDLGPNFYPTTKLLILNATSLDILHTIPLYLSDATLASDVHEDDVSATQDFIALQDQQDYILEPPGDAPVVSVVEVRYNGTPTASWTGPTGQIVHLTFTPDEGDTIDIDYTYQGEIAYKAGNRRYGVAGVDTELRSGASGGLEWAAVFVSQIDRTTGASANRCVLVEMASSLSTAPTVTTHNPTVSAPQSVAVSSGHLLHLEYVGGFWTVQQI